MKRITLLLLYVLGFPAVSGAQMPQAPKLKEEIAAMERLFAEAVKSRDTMQTKKLQTDRFYLAIGVQGMPLQIIPRQQWLAALKDYVTESVTIDDIKVTGYGNTAVAMVLYTQKATVHGQDRSAQFVITDTWVKEEGGWKIDARHSSRPEQPSTTRPK